MKKVFLMALAVVALSLSCTKREVREEKYELSDQLHKKFEVKETDNGSFIKDGYYKEWYKNGQIFSSGNYKNNMKEGKWEYWYESGKKKLDCSFVRDSLNGEYVSWYENEQMKDKSNYKNGVLVGEEVSWHKNGQLHYKGLYDAGDMVGEWNYLNDKGEIYKSLKYSKSENLTILGKWKGSDGQVEFMENKKFIYKSKYGYVEEGSWSYKNSNFVMNGAIMDVLFLTDDSLAVNEERRITWGWSRYTHYIDLRMKRVK